MNADKMNAFFKARRADHVARVNRYAAKIGRRFPMHDADKFCEPLVSRIAPMIWCRHHNAEPSNRDLQRALAALAAHRKANAHHPESWASVADMTEDALCEMCCDWCATGERGAHGRPVAPRVWAFYRKTALPRYKFLPAQQRMIKDLLMKLVGGDDE